MGLLKRKDEKSEAIAMRVPASLKAELEELRRRADAAGFDLTATITETLTRLARQVRSELDGPELKRNGIGGAKKGSGLTPAVMPNGGAA